MHPSINKATRLILLCLLVTGTLIVGSITHPVQSVRAATKVGFNTFIPLVSNLQADRPAAVTPIGAGGDPAINALGDIAACSPNYTARDGQYQTAALLSGLDGAIFGLGDYAYYDSSPALFTNCFNPVWAPLKSRMFPSAGNHEYLTPAAAGYFGYFGSAAGNPTAGYYSFDLGDWHIVVLNSNCVPAGGCDPLSPQATWLAADLSAHPALCTLAFWHHPLYSSGKEGNTPRVLPLWQILYQNHEDVVLNGHDHSYERFAPMDPTGTADPINGITEFVVGTGGKDHSPLRSLQPNSVVFQNTDFGVLRMVLHATSYDFQFIPVAGGTFTDSGSGSCH